MTERVNRYSWQTQLMRTEVITIRTGSRPVVRDITAEASRFAESEADGLLHVFVPHATAGLAIIETGAGSDDDLLAAIDELLPAEDRWRHRHGSRGHGRDHVLPAWIPPYATLPVIGGKIALGTWQSICLVDPNGDNPTRQVRFSFIEG
jgi:secondary thiamine-phosphate synthase enzyme